MQNPARKFSPHRAVIFDMIVGKIVEQFQYIFKLAPCIFIGRPI